MHACDYNAKLSRIIDDTTKFEEVAWNGEVKQHPILKQERKVQNYIRKLIKPHVDEEEYRQLYPSGSKIGGIYGVAKVRKSGMPLRPIVSTIGTPQYALAKYLDKHLRQYIPRQHTVLSSHDFTDKLKYAHFHSTHCSVVSLDVISLYTNVPLMKSIDLTVQYVFDKSNFCHLPFSRKELRELLIVANSEIFSFNNKLYKQIDGVSMGNPLAPLLADMFMGNLENAIYNEPKSFFPKIYYRYVDDTFAVFSDPSDAPKFLELLNKQDPNIKFSMENSVNNSLAFLDTRVSWNGSDFTHEVYRKPTFTGRLLDFHAACPVRWKVGLIKNLIFRAYRLSSSWNIFHDEVSKLHTLLCFNSYPKWWLEKHVRNFLNRNFSHSSIISTEDRDPLYIRFPYVGKASEMLSSQIFKMMQQCGVKKTIRLAFSARRAKSLFPLKDVCPTLLRSTVVYKYRCLEDPNIYYIGQTTRHLFQRVVEHTTQSNSSIFDHRSGCNSCSGKGLGDTAKQFQIIAKANNNFDNLIKEALLIRKHRPVLNRQQHQGLCYTLKLF